MQAPFADLVGTAIVPTHCYNSNELRDLAPNLDTATAAHDLAEQASEAAAGPQLSIISCHTSGCLTTE